MDGGQSRRDFIRISAAAAGGLLVAVYVPSSRAGASALPDADGWQGNAFVHVAADGTVTIKANRLYKLVHMPDYGEHTLQLDVEGAGLDAYTFTFG